MGAGRETAGSGVVGRLWRPLLGPCSRVQTLAKLEPGSERSNGNNSFGPTLREPLVCWTWTVEVALFLFSEMGRQNLFDIKAVGLFVWSKDEP